jgi:hypothetical protein
MNPEDIPEHIIKAAKAYDWANRPKPANWQQVPDAQVRRLLAGSFEYVRELAEAEHGVSD